MNVVLTQHARIRLQQRGISEQDVEAILGAGTSVDGESVLLLEQDVQREVRKRKREIAMLERLRGCRVVLADQRTVVTVYRMGPKASKRLMRGGRRGKNVLPSIRDTAPSSQSKP